MKWVQLVLAVLALVGSIMLIRIVVHGLSDHGHLDVFHLLVALGGGVGGLMLIRRALSPRRAS
jgi:hypothetical protein